MSKLPKTGKLIALDLGTKVTGVAISDAAQRMAFPRDELFHANENELLESLKELLRGEQAVGFVIGLPVGWEGEDSRQTEWVRKIADELEQEVPVELIDESLSSQEIEGVSRLKRKDSEVALGLLSKYLDAR